MIELRNLSFAYDEPLLRDLNLALPDSGFVSVLGPNGSGKTTLLRIMAGLLRPQSGEALLDGTPVFLIPAGKRARRMAWVSQGLESDMGFTVLETVLMGRYALHSRLEPETASDYEAARCALREAGVEHLCERRMDALSGGERQRVLIARALCQDTPILLLDEPVSNLDIRHQVAILRLARERVEQKKALVVCVLHDLNLAQRYSDRILLLRDGCLMADGTPDEVLEAGLLQRVYGIPLLYSRNEEGPLWFPSTAPVDSFLQ